MLKFFVQGAILGLIMAILFAFVDSRLKSKKTAVRKAIQTLIFIGFILLMTLTRAL